MLAIAIQRPQKCISRFQLAESMLQCSHYAKLKLTIQGANKQEKEFQENNSIINSKYKDVKEATKPEPLVYKTEDKE